MAKKIMKIIECCSNCEDNMYCACWNIKFATHRDFTENDNTIRGFPEWCPLEDYKNGNENE